MDAKIWTETLAMKIMLIVIDNG